MTVVVTRDVAQRFRGFLASCMLELAPGVYTAPRMNKAVRERVWSVLADWYAELGGGGIVMTWRDTTQPGGQAVAILGDPSKSMLEYDGFVLASRPLGANDKVDDALDREEFNSESGPSS